MALTRATYNTLVLPTPRQSPTLASLLRTLRNPHTAATQWSMRDQSLVVGWGREQGENEHQQQIHRRS